MSCRAPWTRALLYKMFAMCASCSHPPARRSPFIRSLFCTLLVAFPALAQPITGLDNIKLGANRTLRLVVRPEARCELGDLDAIALEVKKMAQERADPAATNILLTQQSSRSVRASRSW